MKHIVCCGCSFTRDHYRYNINGTDLDYLKDNKKIWKWPHFLKENLNDSKIYNLGSPTNDNSVVRKSIIYKVDKLLKEGISPKDIIVLVQWSSWQRNSFYISRDRARLSKSLLYKFKGVHGEYSHISDFINGKSQIGQYGYYLLTGGFAIDHVPYPIKKLINTYVDEFFSEEESQIRFFENIIFLQSYLKSHDIKNLSFNLQNNFSNYYVKQGFPGLLNDEEVPYNSIYIDKFIPKTIDDDTDLNYDNPYIQHLFDMIDFDKFWFLKNEDTLYGGLMEWAVKNYDIETDKNVNGLWYEFAGITPDDLKKKLKRNDWCFGHLSAMMNEKFVKEELLGNEILSQER
tara:strand:- start:27568 stop:28599 length:1032 start_codon:yes stop_codon:yes gene_type:complete